MDHHVYKLKMFQKIKIIRKRSVLGIGKLDKERSGLIRKKCKNIRGDRQKCKIIQVYAPTVEHE